MEDATVELNLDLGYKIKLGEEYQFLEPYEVEEGNEAAVAALTVLPASAIGEQRLVAAQKARRAYVDELKKTISFAVRISSYLLRTAITRKYKKDGEQQLSLPRSRKTSEGYKVGKWYGELTERFSDGDPKIEISVLQAAWLLSVWDDDKVQDGFEPAV